MPDKISLAIIGGSGLYNMAGLNNIEEKHISTPFGPPSDPVVVGEFNGQRVAFLARHGRGHRLTPSEVNYRANIYTLKMLGVERIISVSACGSLREDYAPGHIVIPDQLYDNTKGRERTFFGHGLVAHVGAADPFCPDLSAQLFDAVKATGAAAHKGGAFITIEGPRFSTKAESQTFRSWGMSLIGMTTSPEAFLAREAEICYAVMAHVTDYDVWHVSEAPVTVEMVIRILTRNTTIAQQAISSIAGTLRPERNCSCGSAIKDAIITDRARIPEEVRNELRAIVGKYLK
ncbi:MAG TPA: S-methyl-5'-thioadenosine phosphorylase [Anaerolineales bacterium]|nr:S-methyl-5'-thioadenosine phosphorylase [Anaerolineales bacterium]